MNTIKQVGLSNFKQEVADPSLTQPVLIEFYSNDCRYCTLMRPVLHDIAADGNRVVMIDIEKEPELANHFKVQSLPTFLVVKDKKGHVVAKGMTTRKTLLTGLAA